LISTSISIVISIGFDGIMGSHIDKIHSHIKDHLVQHVANHLIQHTSQIPKGFLRQKTLELLGEKTLSGSEIAEEILRRTSGQWKPGPGSIYPLLAWLQKNGYAVEQPVEKSGMKRYALTETGREFLEEQKKLSMGLENKERAMTFCLMDLLWFDGQDEIAGDLHKSMVRLVSALSEFNAIMNQKVSKGAAMGVKKIADEAAQKIEDMNSSLKR
jgi:DNA-binding PadR family transcriptional regulator